MFTCIYICIYNRLILKKLIILKSTWKQYIYISTLGPWNDRKRRDMTGSNVAIINSQDYIQTKFSLHNRTCRSCAMHVSRSIHFHFASGLPKTLMRSDDGRMSSISWWASNLTLFLFANWRSAGGSAQHSVALIWSMTGFISVALINSPRRWAEHSAIPKFSTSALISEQETSLFQISNKASLDQVSVESEKVSPCRDITKFLIGDRFGARHSSATSWKMQLAASPLTPGGRKSFALISTAPKDVAEHGGATYEGMSFLDIPGCLDSHVLMEFSSRVANVRSGWASTRVLPVLIIIVVRAAETNLQA